MTTINALAEVSIQVNGLFLKRNVFTEDVYVVGEKKAFKTFLLGIQHLIRCYAHSHDTKNIIFLQYGLNQDSSGIKFPQNHKTIAYKSNLNEDDELTSPTSKVPWKHNILCINELTIGIKHRMIVPSNISIPYLEILSVRVQPSMSQLPSWWQPIIDFARSLISSSRRRQLAR
jgi:hypothetical protein